MSQGRFVHGTICPMGHFVPVHGMFCPGTDRPGKLRSGTHYQGTEFSEGEAHL
jgi:hypothetical protein